MAVTSCRPIADVEWPPEIADLRDGFAGKLNVYRVMAHHPGLLRSWAPLRRHVVQESALGAERSEVVILRAAYRMGSDYEWAHHVSRARKLGFSDARIAAIGDVPLLPPPRLMRRGSIVTGNDQLRRDRPRKNVPGLYNGDHNDNRPR